MIITTCKWRRACKWSNRAQASREGDPTTVLSGNSRAPFPSGRQNPGVACLSELQRSFPRTNDLTGQHDRRHRHAAIVRQNGSREALHSRRTPLVVPHGSVANDQVVNTLELSLKLRGHATHPDGDVRMWVSVHTIAAHLHGLHSQGRLHRDTSIVIRAYVPVQCHAHVRVALSSKWKQRHRARARGGGGVVAGGAMAVEVDSLDRRCHRERKRSAAK